MDRSTRQDHTPHRTFSPRGWTFLLLALAAVFLFSGCGTVLTGVVGYMLGTSDDVTEYDDPPTGVMITSLDPSQGPLAGGTVVTLFGLRFQNGCTVDVGGAPATNVVFISPTQVRCTVPASATAGPAAVILTNPDGSGASGTYTYSNWYLNSWGMRSSFTVTNGTAADLTDFQVQITIPYDSDMNTDFSDLRFTYTDGTLESPASFWVETYTASTDATVWVEVPLLPASAAATLYVYYGNAQAASGSNFSATFTKEVDITDLAGHWHFDEGTGTEAQDASANANLAELLSLSSPHGWLGADGGQWGSRTDMNFSTGSALRFDGRDDWLNAGTSTTLDPTTALTVEAWVRAEGSSWRGSEQTLAAKWQISGTFDDTSRWAFYDAEENLPNALGGYRGAGFDGRYIYFVPNDDGTSTHGEVLRYDTQADFNTAASWSVFDPGYGTDGTDGLDALLSMSLDGFQGALFDGRHMYFAPNDNGIDYHSQVLRYDTTLAFDQVASWTAFDPAQDTAAPWSTKNTLPNNLRAAGCAEVGGLIYVMGGHTGSSQASAVHVYDPVGGNWTTQTGTMPVAKEAFGCAAANGLIYTVGGSTGTGLDTVEEYNPATDVWTPKAVLPAAPFGARYALGCASVNGKVYAIAGWTGAVYVTECLEYDPATDAWTAKAPIPTIRRSHVCCAVNGKIYAIGGYNGSFLTSVQMYDPATNTWTNRSPMPTARENHTAAVINGKIYVTGGWNGAYRAELEVYDPVVDTWAVKANLPTARNQLFSAGQGGVFYVMGGTTGSALNNVDAYDTSVAGVGSELGGYRAGVFDGRYLYFVPYRNNTRYHGEILRYDTTATFDALTSWSSFQLDASSVTQQGMGLASAVYDGRYVYFTPYRNASNNHGEFARYDTQGDFQNPASWTAYDPGESGLDALSGYDLDGYTGGTFDGRYLYFSPYRANVSGNPQYHGAVLRYDTKGDFQTLSSWSAIDPGYGSDGTDGLDQLHAVDLDGFTGALFDGRYIHFTPRFNGSAAHGRVLRYDTRYGFTDLSSWSFADAGPANDTGGLPEVDLDGYFGSVFDGRYIYHVPFDAGGTKAEHAQVLRYDTTGSDAAYKLLRSPAGTYGSYSGGLSGLTALVNTANGPFTLTAGNNLDDGAWHHVAMTYEGSTLALYVDGALASSTAATGAVQTCTAPFTVGTFFEGRSYFEGTLDEVRAFNRALTLEEIQAHYQRRKFAATAPTVSALGTEETK